uniref:Uncharacterized protein n=1 Tax=Pithovirus LCDPAC01 TaxID=2506600 RepID=A0A481YQ27_9VIRU|nr:MAG: hypothetical protein LCDPAC01_00040 [Pithovirus LCDPAC01]
MVDKGILPNEKVIQITSISGHRYTLNSLPVVKTFIDHVREEHINVLLETKQ